MNALLILVIVLVIALIALTLEHFRVRASRPTAGATRTRRILFPYIAGVLSESALDAALRLATAEEATLVPVFLARVPLYLPLDAPLPRQSEIVIPLADAVEARAGAAGVPVDCRIERGRTYRHALRQTIAGERFDRIVIAAAAQGRSGFDADTVAWLLDHAPGEIVVLRPAKDDRLGPPRPKGKHRAQRRRRQPTAALG